MTDTNSMVPGSRPVVDDKGFVLAVYILYLVGFVTGGAATLVGLIIAYLKSSTADETLRTHFQFQIRTFWIGLLYGLISALLCLVIIGFFLLLALAVWILVRCIKGLMLLNEGRPIANPRSWMIG